MKMTKEEVIAQIEKLKSYCEYMKDSDENGAYVFDLDVQALDFVLSALTQPNEALTCDGCISLGTSYGPCMNCIRSRLRGDMYHCSQEVLKNE